MKSGAHEVICADCGRRGCAKETERGNLAIEILLWLLLLLPGAVYSIWRLPRCPRCRSLRLLPVNSPIGRELVAKFGRDEEGGCDRGDDRPADKAMAGEEGAIFGEGLEG